MNKILILIYTKNNQQSIPETLNSLLIQTYKNFDIVCIDDSSEDSTFNILTRYAKFDNRITCFQFNENSTNNKINSLLSDCDYVIFLAQNSYLPTTALERAITKIKINDSDIYVSGALSVDRNQSKNIINNIFQNNEYNLLNQKNISNLQNISNTLISRLSSYQTLKLYKQKLCKNFGINSSKNLPIGECLFKTVASNSNVFFDIVPLCCNIINQKNDICIKNIIKPKISIIIPVYNAEKTLDKTLKSLLLQDYENLEIICVNDGSTDFSLDILNNYKNKDSRFVVISQKNQGQSIARNAGVELATGEYISFLDADDWISLDLYNSFAKRLAQNTDDIDMYLFNGVNYTAKANIENDIYIRPFIKNSSWKNSTNNIHKFDDYNNPFSGTLAVYNKIYKSSVIKNITFKNTAPFEDQSYSLETFLACDNIYFENKYYYYYNHLTTSSIRTLKENAFNLFQTITDIEEMLKQANLFADYKYAFYQHQYRQYAYLYFQVIPEFREKFYQLAQKNLQMLLKELEPNIVNQMSDIYLSNEILSLNYLEFFNKYKSKVQE